MADLVPVLTEADCEKTLFKFLGSKDYHLRSFKISPFHNSYEGLIGEHFTLQIEYSIQDEVKTHKFFVKKLSSNNVMLNLSKEIFVYEKEEFFYTTLIPGLKKYGIDYSFTPEGYFFKPYVTVLQDLGLDGFHGTVKRQPLDLNHSKLCLETLAKFHGSSIVYESARSKEEGKKYCLNVEHATVLEDKVFTGENNGATKYLRCSIKGLFDLIDAIPDDNSNIDNEDFKEKLREAMEELLSVNVEKSNEIRLTIVHGDLWSSNFLFTYKDGQPSACKLLDYQTISYGPMQLDVMKFIMTNTRRQFRDENTTALIEHYHDSLLKVLRKHDVKNEVLPLEEFVETCEIFKLAAKVHAIVDRSTTFLPDEAYAQAIKSDDSFGKFLFEERGRYIVDAYKNSLEFRDVMLEDVLELRDMLFTDI